jgi:transposase
MQGNKFISPKLMYQVSLNDLVAKDNFYRKVDQYINFQFLYSATASYYGSEGQESIDPVVFFKICIVGYLNNIVSDRRLIEYCSNCLDVRLFLKYDLDEKLPWHSTISRTRQLYGEEVFHTLFKKVLSLCVSHGMVRGKRQAIDSAYIKANASMDSLVEKEVIEDIDKYTNELNEGSEFKVSASRKKWVEQHHNWKKEAYKGMPGNTNDNKLDEYGNLIRPKFLSNHTHFSPTDSDARISVKPGKARQLNYLSQLAVDDGHHVIVASLADFADKRDSQCIKQIVEQAKENLIENEMALGQICADTGYSSGDALNYIEENNIDAWIPNFGQYIPEREGFIHNKDLDQYECQRGNKAILPLKGIRQDSKGYTKKTYRSSETVCKDCPLRKSCCGKKTKFKKIDDSIYKPLYDKMHIKMQTPYAKQMSRIRSKTVEPVLGTLLNFLGMRKVYTRGINSVHKHCLMASLCYNLKKLIKFKSTKLKIEANALKINEHLKEKYQLIKLCFYYKPWLVQFRFFIKII